MKQLFGFGVLSVGIQPTLAAVPSSPDSASRLATGSTSTGVMLEIAVVLAGVIVLIIGLGWLIRRVGNFPAAGKGMVRILGGVSLGPRERAVILEAGDKRLLVGVAPGRVETLCILGSVQNSADSQTQEEQAFSSKLNAELQDAAQ